MRVISGKFKGRHLKSIKSQATRPTSDKVKESIFNMIGPYFEAGEVLDLYAGSGALSIEAISRGMNQALLFDTNPKSIKMITENIKNLNALDHFQIILGDGKKKLLQYYQKKSFDLVFLDPPYAKQKIEEDLNFLIENHFLKVNAIAVCEVDKTIDLPDKISDLKCIRKNNYGNTKVYIYQMEGVN